ncbi:L-threonylcarbamoyladenylate synthase [Paraferrimonas sedimenticola]|uniref:Threonylcarbamoyl-AMP synthase n=1 Tax=Paraferrimonas sedimenticola TaxID=375674 RepID=A0AA37RZS1_9GAMM|nr:L-threonylcarbamoyladenylate synthase [Paraferrimonas sedimenticola]GLP97702.1 threonylcarbamoyl-AMP synthase [Paraferrimonas sedimenticola]
MALCSVEQAVSALQQGQLIVYPTEAVYGVGCDPDNEQALQAVLDLKQRPWQKGLILIASDFDMLAPYLELSALSDSRLETIQASWPGPNTWVIPAKSFVSPLLRGQFDSLAVRVTGHSAAAELCRAFGKPIVSTSANLSGHPAAMDWQAVQQQLGDQVPILDGPLGGATSPSTIRDAITGNTLRP